MVIYLLVEAGSGSLIGRDLNVNFDRPEQTEDITLINLAFLPLCQLPSINSLQGYMNLHFFIPHKLEVLKGVELPMRKISYNLTRNFWSDALVCHLLVQSTS